MSLTKLQVRKAPPVPKTSFDEEEEDVETSTNNVERSTSNNFETVAQINTERPKHNAERSKNDSGRPKNEVDRSSQHSYEEIAASEANSEVTF